MISEISEAHLTPIDTPSSGDLVRLLGLARDAVILLIAGVFYNVVMVTHLKR